MFLDCARNERIAAVTFEIYFTCNPVIPSYDLTMAALNPQFVRYFFRLENVTSQDFIQFLTSAGNVAVIHSSIGEILYFIYLFY